MLMHSSVLILSAMSPDKQEMLGIKKALLSANKNPKNQAYNGSSYLRVGEETSMKHRGLLACISIVLMFVLCPILSFAEDVGSSEPLASPEAEVTEQELGDYSDGMAALELEVDASSIDSDAEASDQQSTQAQTDSDGAIDVIAISVDGGNEERLVDSTQDVALQSDEGGAANQGALLTAMEDSDGESSSEEDMKSYYIGDYPIALSATTLRYKGKGVYPTVKIPGLVEGTDFEVYYSWDDEWWEYSRSDNHSGTYSLEVYGIGDYYGSVTRSYKVIETRISLSKTSAAIYRKGTTQIKATVSSAEGATTYESSNTKVATVSAAGKVTGKNAGTAKITVKNGYAKKTFTVKVKNPTLNKKKASMYAGEAFTLSAKGAIGKCSFKSGNKKIASVSKKGVVKAKKKGKCVITVKANGVKLNCTVKVKPPKLSKKKMTVYNSYTKKLTFYGGKGKVKWSSSNKSIATVSKKGTVKGKKGGTCVITAKRGKYTLKCKVTVPKHYEGYAKIPDFGALYGKTEIPSKSDYDNGTYYSVYKAGKSYAEKYKKKLKKSGFKFYQKKSGTYVYMNKNYDFVAVAYAKGYICIAYQNLYDSYDDGSDDYDDDYDYDYDDYDDYDDDDDYDYDDYDDDTYDDYTYDDGSDYYYDDENY